MENMEYMFISLVISLKDVQLLEHTTIHIT
jgi:hypothetical protein